VPITGHPPDEAVRVHLDLCTTEQERQIERLVGLGATRVDDWDHPAQPGSWCSAIRNGSG
jgi:hypothetical protein